MTLVLWLWGIAGLCAVAGCSRHVSPRTNDLGIALSVVFFFVGVISMAVQL